jgi:hypothetical protein
LKPRIARGAFCFRKFKHRSLRFVITGFIPVIHRADILPSDKQPDGLPGQARQ